MFSGRNPFSYVFVYFVFKMSHMNSYRLFNTRILLQSFLSGRRTSMPFCLISSLIITVYSVSETELLFSN